MTHSRLMPAQTETLFAFEQIAHNVDTTCDFFLTDLLGPLKGGKGFGNKGREGGCDLKPGIARTCRITHFTAQVHNGLQIFIGFCWQPDHEVEFDHAPAVLKELLGMQKNILFADALIDDIAQSL